MAMALGEASKAPVSMTPNNVICSCQILIIVSLKAETNFFLSSSACASLISFNGSLVVEHEIEASDETGLLDEEQSANELLAD